MKYVLAVDQGTTSTRTIAFGADGLPVAVAQREFKQIYPHPGWVEHDPHDLWHTTLATMREVLRQPALDPASVAAIGITNQRETTLIWNRKTGEPICNAIVWQDRRTSDLCERLIADGCEGMVVERTGLLIDSYFSATKIRWMLDNVPDARDLRRRASWPSAPSTATCCGDRRVAQSTPPMRRMHRVRSCSTSIADWDDELLRFFDVPRSLLPQVRDTAGQFGLWQPSTLTELPVLAVVGINRPRSSDRHASSREW
jgi:glycerol kinase